MNFLIDNNVSLPVYEIAYRLLLSAILSGFFALIYLKFKSEETDRKQLAISMVFVALTISMILMAVDQSLPRAFGLFAALSIIRFRMPIRNFKDITFLFIAIGIGIVCGSGAVKIALVSAVMIALIFIFFSVLFSQIKTRSIYYLSIQIQKISDSTEIEIENFFKNFDYKFKLSESYNISNTEAELIYKIETEKINFTSFQEKLNEVQIKGIISSRLLSRIQPDDLGI